jgi:xanthine/uracil permease
MTRVLLVIFLLLSLAMLVSGILAMVYAPGMTEGESSLLSWLGAAFMAAGLIASDCGRAGTIITDHRGSFRTRSG